MDMMNKIQSQYDTLINNNLNSNKDINESENYSNFNPSISRDTETIKNLSKINNIHDESIAITEFKDDDKVFERKNDKNILMMIADKIDHL